MHGSHRPREERVLHACSHRTGTRHRLHADRTHGRPHGAARSITSNGKEESVGQRVSCDPDQPLSSDRARIGRTAGVGACR
eukprot:453169-Prymnesium_polylepis.1